jgi:membrane protease YdiL (CAAX protease family)
MKGTVALHSARIRPRLVEWLAGLRVAPLWVVVIAISADFASAVWTCLWFPSGALETVNRLAHSTGGVLTGNLVINICEFLIVVGGIVLGLGRLNWQDLGLGRRTIIQGLLFGMCVWVTSNVLLLGVASIEREAVGFDLQWIEATGKTIGIALAAVGTATCEEAVFRGFLLTQLALRFKRSSPARFKIALVATLTASSVVFAAGHVPYLLHEQTPLEQYPANLMVWFGYGLLFGAVYLRSRNLLFSIAVHALILAPGLVETSYGDKTVLLFTVACWLLYPVLRQVLHAVVPSRAAGE